MCLARCTRLLGQLIGVQNRTATGHAHIIRRQIGLYVLFDQYNGAYSEENFGLHREVHIMHMASEEREPITEVWGHRRTGTLTFWIGGTVPSKTVLDLLKPV